MPCNCRSECFPWGALFTIVVEGSDVGMEQVEYTLNCVSSLSA